MINKFDQQTKRMMMSDAAAAVRQNNNSRYQNNNSGRRPYRKSKQEVNEEIKRAEEERKKQQDELNQKNCELTETNFPSLGTPTSQVRVWGGTKSFAELAVEWDEKKKKEEHEKKVEEVVQPVKNRQNVPLPRFNNIHRFVEQEDFEQPEQKPTEEDDWVTVRHKKIRREKTFEEKIQKIKEDQSYEDVHDESVWNNDAPQEHETCWDTRP